MAEPGPSDEPLQNRQPFFEWIIPVIGIVLIFISIAIACLYSQSILILAIAIALFSVGCVTLWFGFIHPAIRSGEERIEKINKNADRVLLRVSRRKK